MKHAILALTIFLAASCTSEGTDANSSKSTEGTTVTETTPAPPVAATTAEDKAPSAYENKVAELHTTAGEIHIRFFPDVAPNHVRNFLDLAGKKFYDGTKFHRVIPGFMIQGGDPNTKEGGDPNLWGTGNAESNVSAEFNNVTHRRGIVSMARSGHPDSASSQFFICVADATQLDGQYSVFGQVTKGMGVVDKIVAAPRGMNDRPNNPTTITKVTIRDAKPEETGPAPR